MEANFYETKMKFASSVFNGNSLNDGQKEAFSSVQDGLKYVSSKDIDVNSNQISLSTGLAVPVDELSQYKIAPSGSPLLCIEGGSAGRKIGFTETEVCFVNKLACFSPKQGVSGRFIFYSLLSKPFRHQFNQSMAGMIGGVSISSINNFEISLPNYELQCAVAAYLDNEVGRIDSLISEKQSFIELLKEKRQAMISHYVTNSSSRQVRLKFYIDGISSGTSVNAADVPAEPHQHGVLKTSCVYTGEFDYTKNKTVIDEEVLRVSCPLLKDTLIVSRMNTPDLVGAAGLVTESVSNIYLPDRLWQVSFKDGLNPKFAYYWTLSNSYREQVKLACAGTSASMQNLSQDEFQNFLIPQIDESIQHKIVSELDSKLSTLGQLMHETSLSIELLKEHRTALISAAVTGKIDVRDMANNKDAS